MPGLVYHVGALIAAERHDTAMWALHHGALTQGVSPLVPAPVLARVWRDGPRQPILSRLLAGCALADFPVRQAYAVGRLLGLAGTSDIVDGAVVLTALAARAAVVTADPERLRRLTDALDIRLAMTTV